MAHRLQRVGKSSGLKSRKRRQERAGFSWPCRARGVTLFLVGFASMFASLQIVMLPSFLVALDPIPAPLAVPLAPVHTNTNTNMKTNFATPSQGLDLDRNCPFRSSKIYRSIYVYPSPGTEEWLRNDSGVVTGKRSQLGKYPWDAIDEKDRKLSIGLYELDSQLMQVIHTRAGTLPTYSMLHSSSESRTHPSPEPTSSPYTGTLLASAVHHRATRAGNHHQSKFLSSNPQSRQSLSFLRTVFTSNRAAQWIHHRGRLPDIAIWAGTHGCTRFQIRGMGDSFWFDFKILEAKKRVRSHTSLQRAHARIVASKKSPWQFSFCQQSASVGAAHRCICGAQYNLRWNVPSLRSQKHFDALSQHRRSMVQFSS